MEEGPLPETAASSTAAAEPPADVTGPPSIPADPSSPRTPKFRLKKKVLFLGLFFLLIVSPAAAFFALGTGALKLSFIPEEIALGLVKTYAKLPLVPKKPIHILLLSLDSSLQIKTFTTDASLSLGELDISFFGETEIKEETTDASFHIRAKSVSPVLSLNLEADLISLDKILYFKIDALESPLLAALTTLDLEPVLGEWWKYDLTPLETQAREELEKAQAGETENLAQKFQEKAFAVLSEPEISNAITREEDEKLGEEESYHLRAKITQELFAKFWEALQGKPLTAQEKEDLGKYFESFEADLDLWIGKGTLVTRKIKVAFKIKPALQEESPSPYFGLLQSFTAGVFVEETSKINAPVSILAPSEASDVQDLVKLLFGDLPPLDVLGEQTKLLLEGQRP